MSSPRINSCTRIMRVLCCCIKQKGDSEQSPLLSAGNLPVSNDSASALFQASAASNEAVQSEAASRSSSSSSINTPQVDYQVIRTNIKRTEEKDTRSLYVGCMAKPIFSNIPSSQSGEPIYVLEEEVVPDCV